MTLSEYIKGSEGSQSDLARRIGVSRSYLSEIVSGAKTPSLAVAVKIEEETGGTVVATSFIAQSGVTP